MREPGEVVQVDDHHVVVQMRPRGGCRRCALNRLCSAGERRVRARGWRNVDVGDLVEVEIPARGVTTAAFLVFFLPLVVSLAASLIAYSLTGRWAWGIICFFGGLILVEGIVSLMDRRWRGSESFQPTIVRKIAGDCEEGGSPLNGIGW